MKQSISSNSVLITRKEMTHPNQIEDGQGQVSPLAQQTVGTMSERQEIETCLITTSDEGLTTLRFDPAQVVLSFDLQRGVITIAKKIRATEVLGELLLQTAPMLSETLVHQQIQEIFAAVVGIPIEQINCNDFFEAGGDVELASLLSAIKDRFGVDLDPVIVYDHPNLADLASVIVETANREQMLKREAIH